MKTRCLVPADAAQHRRSIELCNKDSHSEVRAHNRTLVLTESMNYVYRHFKVLSWYRLDMYVIRITHYSITIFQTNMSDHDACIHALKTRTHFRN